MFGPPAKPSGSEDSIARGALLAAVFLETRGKFKVKGRDKDFKEVLQFKNSAEETAARVRLCQLMHW